MRRLAGTLAAALLAAPLAARAAPAPVQPAAFAHGARGARRIALTFDACTTSREPTPYDPRITAELEALRVPATIFVGGGWAEREPEALAALARDPLFEIGNHTWSHPHLTRLAPARIREELLRTQRAIAAGTGRVPTLFRPPYGEYDAAVLRAAAEVGLTTVEYDLPSGDPGPGTSAGALVRWVLAAARPGSIVVMHINHPGFPTAEALPEIVAGLRARGFELVTVGELLRATAPPQATRLGSKARAAAGAGPGTDAGRGTG
jgi:peptidoglycan/xylan/chitin deacetylase (PgdA/CDA1 family)